MVHVLGADDSERNFLKKLSLYLSRISLQVRRSLKIPGRRKEKEKLPSGITADYSASFFAHLDRDLLDATQNTDSGLGSTISAGTSSWSSVRTPDGLMQSDSSEASLTSLMTTTTTSSTTTSHAGGKNLPPLPPKPPKRGILKGPRLSVSSGIVSVLSEENALPNGTETSYQEASNLLVRNTLQNEVIAYQNVPTHFNSVLNKDEVCSEEETLCQTTWRVVTTPQQAVQQHYQQQQQHHQIDAKLLQVR